MRESFLLENHLYIFTSITDLRKICDVKFTMSSKGNDIKLFALACSTKPIIFSQRNDSLFVSIRFRQNVISNQMLRFLSIDNRTLSLWAATVEPGATLALLT